MIPADPLRNLGSATILRADARQLPLADNSVDLVVTSPPYFALRSYQDAGEHYAGQLGSEATPTEFVDALIACTREMVRVVKPSGSIWVNLGDKYSTYESRPGNAATHEWAQKSQQASRYTRNAPEANGVPYKSLMGIPWRYALRCIDDLGLILRAEVIWSKPNGLPESVTDRVRRSHEQWFHFTLSPRYYSAVDEIREEHAPAGLARRAYNYQAGHDGGTNGDSNGPLRTGGLRPANVLGKLPGSVWTIPTEPLRVPDHLGIDHFAAFPSGWPRRIIRGWSPAGVCTACGEGRRPVSDVTYEQDADARRERLGPSKTAAVGIGTLHGNGQAGLGRVTTITGYACACTHYTDHPGTGGSNRRSDNPYGTPGREQGVYSNKAREYERVGPHREYHFDQWTPAPTTPAVVLDPFGGTGTVAMVARALGRHGMHADLSADYNRLARWRITDLDQLAAVQGHQRTKRQPDDQPTLLDEIPEVSA